MTSINDNINNGKLFYITSVKSIVIKHLLETIKPFIKETNFLFTPQGIRFCTKDKSDSFITQVELNAESFEYYYCKDSHVIGLDTVLFFKAIKSTAKDDTITFYVNENDELHLHIELRNSIQGKTKTQSLPLINLNNRIPRIQEMEYDYTCSLSTTEFQTIVKDFHLIDARDIEVSFIQKQLSLKSLDGASELLFLLEEKNDAKSIVKFEKHASHIVQGIFNNSHLLNFIKASHLCYKMKIMMKNDIPLILEYYIADLGTLQFSLFPKIED
jgi:proliferating cell nuclear antigen PCNA